MKYAFILYCLFFNCLNLSFATAPCMYYSEEQFIENVLHKSNLIVVGKVLDFSATDEKNAKWTEIEVARPIYPLNLAKPKIRINNFQANDDPFFNYEKGTLLLLFLQDLEGGYQIANDSWKFCVPGIWGVNEKEETYRNFKVKDNQSPWLPLKEIEAWIGKQQSARKH